MTTPYMGMTLPTVGVTADPTWASNLNSALTVVDGHNHVSGSGVQVPVAGIVIDDILVFYGNGTEQLGYSAYVSQAQAYSSGFRNTVYAVTGNLYYNNGSGVAIPITAGNFLATSGSSAQVFTETSTTVNLTIPANASYTLVLVAASSVPISVTLPAANAVTAGRFFIVADNAANAATLNTTVSPAGADKIDQVATGKVININNGAVFFVSDGVSNWKTIGSAAATTSLPGVIVLAGDLSGSGTSASTPRVGAINGTSVSPGGALANGLFLQTTGAASSSWLPIASGSVPLATTTNTGIIRLQYGIGGTALNPKVGIVDGNANFLLTTTVTGAYSIQDTDIIIPIDSNIGSFTINLPALDDGRFFTIKDIRGRLSSFPVTCSSPAADNIEGVNNTYVLESDYGSYTFVSFTNGWWLI